METPQNLPPLDFIRLIEAEHDHISRLATQLRDLSLSQEQFTALVLELLWRLVRHDVSEELVMRPAFVRYLGTSGLAMADHDRDEHAQIKQQLLVLHSQLRTFANAVPKQTDQVYIINQLNPLLKEMKEHMNNESGEQLPALRAQIGIAESLDLGREYAMTLILTPHLMACTRLPNATTNTRDMMSEVGNFIGDDIDTCRRVLSASIQSDQAAATERLVRDELRVLGVLDPGSKHSSSSLKQKQLKTNL